MVIGVVHGNAVIVASMFFVFVFEGCEISGSRCFHPTMIKAQARLNVCVTNPMKIFMIPKDLMFNILTCVPVAWSILMICPLCNCPSLPWPIYAMKCEHLWNYISCGAFRIGRSISSTNIVLY